jgi:hypothetical protein
MKRDQFNIGMKVKHLGMFWTVMAISDRQVLLHSDIGEHFKWVNFGKLKGSKWN